MIRRSTLIVLEVVLGILALLAIPAAVLLWRLSSGPVAVDFLTPYIAEAFQDSMENSRVEVGATVLQWHWLDRSIDLKATSIEPWRVGAFSGARLRKRCLPPRN